MMVHADDAMMLWAEPPRLPRPSVMPMFERTFPGPIDVSFCGNKCVFVVGIHDARVLSDIRYFQKRLAAFVDGDCLEMTESIAHKIDRSAFHRQCLCPFGGKDDGDCAE